MNDSSTRNNIVIVVLGLLILILSIGLFLSLERNNSNKSNYQKEIDDRDKKINLNNDSIKNLNIIIHLMEDSLSIIETDRKLKEDRVKELALNLKQTKEYYNLSKIKSNEKSKILIAIDTSTSNEYLDSIRNVYFK